VGNGETGGDGGIRIRALSHCRAKTVLTASAAVIHAVIHSGRRAEPIGGDQEPDEGAEELLQKRRIQEDHRDQQEAEKRDHRRGEVLMTDPV
jgi:hypothetical protein